MCRRNAIAARSGTLRAARGCADTTWGATILMEGPGQHRRVSPETVNRSTVTRSPVPEYSRRIREIAMHTTCLYRRRGDNRLRPPPAAGWARALGVEPESGFMGKGISGGYVRSARSLAARGVRRVSPRARARSATATCTYSGNPLCTVRRVAGARACVARSTGPFDEVEAKGRQRKRCRQLAAPGTRSSATVRWAWHVRRSGVRARAAGSRRSGGAGRPDPQDRKRGPGGRGAACSPGPACRVPTTRAATTST